MVNVFFCSQDVVVKETNRSCSEANKGLLRLDGGRLQYCNGKNWIQVTGHDIVENSRQNPGKKNIVHFNEHFNRGLVQFWTPSPVTQRRAGREGSRIICLRMLALNQLQRTLRQYVCFTAKSKNWRENYSSTLQGKMSANEVTTPKKHVKPSLENCKVCGITTQINARAVISNPAGKTNHGKNFQAYCSIDVGEEKDSPLLFTRYFEASAILPSQVYTCSEAVSQKTDQPTSMRRQMILDPSLGGVA